jgi:hypothetical protein
MQAEHTRVMAPRPGCQRRAHGALASYAGAGTTAFDSANPLATQLQMVARMIAARHWGHGQLRLGASTRTISPDQVLGASVSTPRWNWVWRL